jgi:hypothetical protein
MDEDNQPGRGRNDDYGEAERVMSKFNSQALRRIAEAIVEKISEDEEISESLHRDFVTSLVRQWITYDGHATLFIGEQQIYFVLGNTSLGEYRIVPEPALPGWVSRVKEDWKLNPDELPEITEQLNRGQGAEVLNTEGIPLRLWVNPKEKSKGVEPLVKQLVPPGRKTDYRTIAAKELEQHLGGDLGEDEMDEFACSVAKQWQQHEGHACLFINEERQLVLKLTEHDDGGCMVTTDTMSVSLGPVLSSLGFPPEAMPEVIARINLGQEIEFRDRKAVPSILRYDPKTRRIVVRALNSHPAGPRNTIPPIFCPKCRGVLRIWRENERQQTCRLCGHSISLS